MLTTSNLNDALSEALKGHTDLIQKNESTILAQKESLTKLEKSLSQSSETADKMSGKVEWLEEEVNKILKLIDEMQVRLIWKLEDNHDSVHNIIMTLFIL